MNSYRRVIPLLAGLVLAACSRSDPAPAAPLSPAAPAAPELSAKLDRTSYGVVHVQAQDFRSLGYGLAYAYAQDNVCMLADSLLTVRGERSRFFGGAAKATAPVDGEYGAALDFIDMNNQDSDFFFKGYLDIEELRASYQAGSKEARDMLAGYAAGYNRYLRDYSGKLPKACAKATWVRPITVDDVYLLVAEKALHASGEVFAREIVDAAREVGSAPAAMAQTAQRAPMDTSFVQQRLQRLSSQLGSNALALGKDLTDNGRGMLLGNPHYPWTSTDRFYQAHLTVPGRYDAMGVILGGIPVVVIGFNRDLAWTHTVTTAAHFTTFKIALDPRDPSGTTYLRDGQPARMRSRTVSVDVLEPDGSLSSRSKTFYFTSHGAVMVRPKAGLTWSADAVHVLADPNRNNTRLIEQWIGIGAARSVVELKATLDKVAGLPWVNTLAADRHGETLFADASVVPNVEPDRFASSCMLIPSLLMFDGSRSACDWQVGGLAQASIVHPSKGPWMMRSDYVGNSNDSYWLSNARSLLTGPYSPLYGATDVPQKLRTRIGFRQLEERLTQPRKMTMGDLRQLAFANRVYAAELVLPELLSMCAQSSEHLLAESCRVLSAWDRRADLESRGAILFREFWNRVASTPHLWRVGFDPRDPVNTPHGIAQDAAPALLASLHQAAKAMHALGLALDAPLGAYQTEMRLGQGIGVHGAVGDIDGSYNSLHMRTDLTQRGYQGVAWGTSYVQTVAFDANGPVAQALLLYGQSVDPASPHYADQLPLYSRKIWPVLPFAEADIKADPNFSTMRLSE